MKASRSCKSVTESNNSEGAVRGMSIGCPVPSRFAVFWRGGGRCCDALFVVTQLHLWVGIMGGACLCLQRELYVH